MSAIPIERIENRILLIGGRKVGRGKHRKYLPLAAVLNSARPVEVSVYVVRAFVRLRELLASNNELARRLDQHEKKLGVHDRAIGGLVSAIRELMAAPEPQRRPIGFVT